MTKYLILKKEGNTWEEITMAEASSARSAVQAAVTDKSVGGQYVAIPSRSWKPVKVELAQALKFS